jgi:hypothetical protein
MYHHKKGLGFVLWIRLKMRERYARSECANVDLMNIHYARMAEYIAEAFTEKVAMLMSAMTLSVASSEMAQNPVDAVNTLVSATRGFCVTTVGFRS